LLALAAVAGLAAFVPEVARAQDASPLPNASPSPSPSPTGLHFSTQAQLTYVSQNTSGQGQVGPEAPGFQNGSPLSPNTPYDTFNSAPLVPGNTGFAEVLSTARYSTAAFVASLQAGLEFTGGSVTNTSYWGESLLPTLNPHLGSQTLPYAIVFPTHPGQDDANAFRLSILSGSIGSADGAILARGGWFDLAQTDRFVFVQPALTSIDPAVAYAPAESLSSGLAGTDLWQPYATQLPLQGADLVAKRGIATLEAATAALPSLPGESARMSIGSVVFDHGEGTRYSAEIVHANTSGLAFTTTVPFGIDPVFTSTPQGLLPTSILNGQEQTVAGLRAAFHVVPRAAVDAVVEIGRAWYDAAPVVRPGTSGSGGYYHVGFSKAAGRATISADFFRMEPRYATLILPYGVQENQWSAAFAWPGQWLKSNYQLIDNSALGVNRQGYRFRYYLDKGPVDVHFEYVNVRQIEAETFSTATQTGYVDGYYLPQPDNAATFGRQQRWGGWAAWHLAFADVTLDYVDDLLYRPFVSTRPQDQVSYEVPQIVATVSRHLSPKAVAAVGYGRYAMKGAFSEPIDFQQHLFFAGLTLQETQHASVLATYRYTTFGGITTYPGSSLSPDFHGPMLLIEQRVTL
jgi:hypothetical protein